MYFHGFIPHSRSNFTEHQMYFTIQRPVFHCMNLFLKESLHSTSFVAENIFLCKEEYL